MLYTKPFLVTTVSPSTPPFQRPVYSLLVTLLFGVPPGNFSISRLICDTKSLKTSYLLSGHLWNISLAFVSAEKFAFPSPIEILVNPVALLNIFDVVVTPEKSPLSVSSERALQLLNVWSNEVNELPNVRSFNEFNIWQLLNM